MCEKGQICSAFRAICRPLSDESDFLSTRTRRQTVPPETRRMAGTPAMRRRPVCRSYFLSVRLMMFPSVSVNQAPFMESNSTTPFTVLSPGRS